MGVMRVPCLPQIKSKVDLNNPSFITGKAVGLFCLFYGLKAFANGLSVAQKICYTLLTWLYVRVPNQSEPRLVLEDIKW